MKTAVIVYGPPGAGKTTVCKSLLENIHNHAYISMYDLLHDLINRKVDGYEEILHLIKRGKLVDDKLFINNIKNLMSSSVKHLIFDGYPRNIEQLVNLSTLLKEYNVDNVVILHFIISKADIYNRLKSRLVCRSCGKNFSANDGINVCNSCGGELYVRDSDNYDVIKNRLKKYDTETDNMILYMSKNFAYHQVDANMDKDSVLIECLKVINETKIS